MPKTLKYQPPMSPIADIYAATVLKLSRDAQEQSKVKLDIPYGSEDEQLLDLYLHESPTSTGVPVLLFIHGGAWTHGYKEWMGSWHQRLHAYRPYSSLSDTDWPQIPSSHLH